MKKINLITSYVTRRIVMSLAGILFAIVGFSQARAQADVNITSVTVTADERVRPTTVGEFPASQRQPGPGVKVIPPPEVLKCSVTVHSYWDDDASQAMLVVVLPVEVSIVSHPSNAVVYKAGGTSPWAGYIVFSLGDMAVQQKITVEFTFTKSTTGNNKVSAYAYSATPDPNPSNNYKDASY